MKKKLNLFKKKVKRFLRNLLRETLLFVIEEYKFLIGIFLFYIICTWPVNYYIIIGGGIDDVSDRISVKDGYDSKGSFNLSYVSELKGTVLSYGLSYIVTSWDRDKFSDYQYSENEDYDDIKFRGNIELAITNSTATKVAFDLAGKSVEKVGSKFYVNAIFDGYDNALLVGDQIIDIEGEKFETIDEFSKVIDGLSHEERINIRVIRNGDEKVVECKLYEDSANERSILGILVGVVEEYKTDPKVEMSFKASESGPSAGLMATLEIYDGLVEEDITRGLKIAGTGTVDLNGKVGDIGGVKYKLMGADAGDADVFLVPKGDNYKEAMKVKKTKKLDIKVIGVESVEEAISELSKLDIK